MRKLLGFSILVLLFGALFGAVAIRLSFPVALVDFGAAIILSCLVYQALILIG